MQQPQVCAPNRKASIRRPGDRNSKNSGMNLQISFVLLQLECRARPAIPVPSHAISPTLRLETRDKKSAPHILAASRPESNSGARDRLVSSRIQNQHLRSKRFDLFQHQPSSRNRNGFGRNRRKTRRDQVGIYKIRAVRVVRQKFAGESSLTRSDFVPQSRKHVRSSNCEAYRCRFGNASLASRSCLIGNSVLCFLFSSN